MTNPEFLPASWTHFLGGPAPYDVDQDDQDDDAPPLEPAAESLTLRRVRAERRRVNDRPS